MKEHELEAVFIPAARGHSTSNVKKTNNINIYKNVSYNNLTLTRRFVVWFVLYLSLMLYIKFSDNEVEF